MYPLYEKDFARGTKVFGAAQWNERIEEVGQDIFG